MAQDRRVTRTKAALTRALFELLGEKEFQKISVTELAQRADVDRKTFYLHYRSVEEILEEFYESAIQRFQEELKREEAHGEEVDMARFFRALNSIMAEKMSLYRRLVKGTGYVYFMERLRAILRAEVEDALRRRGVTNETHIRMSSEVYAAGIMRAYLVWLRGDLDLDQEQFAQQVGRMLHQGLGL